MEQKKSEDGTAAYGYSLADVVEEYSNGIYDSYNLIVQQIQEPSMKSSHLYALIKQLISVAQLLGKEHKEFVRQILQIKWISREKEVIELFHSFLLELVTSNPVHLLQILNSMVLHFLPFSSADISISLIVPQENIFHVIHYTIQKIFELIPLSCSSMPTLLASHYPYVTKDAEVMEWYVKNLLFMTTYQPSLRLPILELILSKAGKFDTLTSRVKILELEDEEEENEKDILDRTRPQKSREKVILENLAIHMETLFQFTQDMCFTDEKLKIKESNELFREFLSIFDRVILPVHGCNHVQFILFYICSLNPCSCEVFLDHLWRKAQDPNTSVILRQTCMAYIASLLARARYIPLATVMATMQSIVPWINSYIRQRESYCGFVNLTGRHGTFFSVCQAVFYVIVFRHKQFFRTNEGSQFLHNLHLEHVVMSQMNPLKYCIDSVAKLFTSIMRMHQVVYCDTIIERNNRQSFKIAGNTEAEGSRINPLDSFFPFDPYLLKNSKRFIVDIYQEWEGE